MRIWDRLLKRIALLDRDDPQWEPESDQEHRPIDYLEQYERTLTDEERVRQLLEDNAGTMWQTEFVFETGWSKSKVSRVLCELDADDAIDRLQLGRQKLVCLPESRPDVTPKGFDEIPEPPTP